MYHNNLYDGFYEDGFPVESVERYTNKHAEDSNNNDVKYNQKEVKQKLKYNELISFIQGFTFNKQERDEIISIVKNRTKII
jgi:hypothetical protein